MNSAVKHFRNMSLMNSLKKNFPKFFSAEFIGKNFEYFFGKFKKKTFLPQKQKATQRENPNKFSRKIRHDLLLGFGVVIHEAQDRHKVFFCTSYH